MFCLCSLLVSCFQGNLISILLKIPIKTDHVSHLPGNAGEKKNKALLDSYTVLQEGILYDVFLQKCSAAWQGAPGRRLTVAIVLPGRQDADDWLNFMLSQKNL